jgi:hypothetical protein
MEENICVEHSGCMTRLDSLERENSRQWGEISEMDKKTDAIMSKLNIVLTSIAVACLMLVINIIVTYASR